MIKYTTEELIQYLYKETPAEKAKEIEKAIEIDWEVCERVDALRHSMHQLDTLLLSPRQQSVLSILNYAKATAEIAQ